MNAMKVSSRLAWSFGILIALLAMIAMISLSRLSGVNASLDQVVSNSAPKVEALNDMAFRAMDNARIVRNIILLKDDKALAKKTRVRSIRTSSPTPSILAILKSI